MILIKGGKVVSSEGVFEKDILINGEKIERVEPSIAAPEGAQVVDVAGKLIFPGFIDAHTHFDLHVAGTVTADGFASGTKAALAGGTTTIIDFGTAYPGESLREGIENWHKKAEEGCSCDYGFHQTITEWNDAVYEGCKQMMEDGITSFKIYMTYDTKLTDEVIMKVLWRLEELGAITGCHCENTGIIDALRDEYASDERKALVSSHYKTRPAAAEAEAVGRLLHMAEIADTPVVVVHLTNEEALEEVRAARKRGQKVYVETCPHYLLLDDSEYETEDFSGAAYICAPPLRKKSDNDALWKAIAQGEIDTISTDHCSFTMDQKRLGEGDFRLIPGGMPGVQDRGILIYSEGVDAGRITPSKMCEVMSEKPALLYGLYERKGFIKPGFDADLCIIDPEGKTMMTAGNRLSKAGYTPFEGRELKGAIDSVYLRGEKLVEGEKVLAENKGTYLRRLPGKFI